VISVASRSMHNGPEPGSVTAAGAAPADHAAVRATRRASSRRVTASSSRARSAKRRHAVEYDATGPARSGVAAQHLDRGEVVAAVDQRDHQIA
jgi:flagella basal body P-ring formation protein FlgA